MNQIPQMKRVDSVDALRGFAVVAIMLLHFVEHFIYPKIRKQSQWQSQLQ